MQGAFIAWIRLLVLTCVVIAAGSAFTLDEKDTDLRKRIESLEKEIEKAKKELENEEKKLNSRKQEKQKVLIELEHTEKKIQTLNKNLFLITNEERLLQRDISSAQHNYNSANRQIEEHKAQYAARLKSIYKRHNVSPFDIVFSTDSFSSFRWGIKMLTVLAEEDMEILETLRARQDTIRVAITTIKSALDAKVALARVKQTEEKQLSSSQKKQKVLLSDIDKDIGLRNEKIEKKLQEKIEAEALIRKYIRQNEEQMKKKGVPPELKGYNFAFLKGKLPWPVSGKVVTRFGLVIDRETKTKVTSRGIEILAKYNEPVRSVGRGSVAMTNSIRGYGNFIIIYHPENYYSVYGHLSDILVNTGDIVDEGITIGTAGSTGLLDVSDVQLKLEVLNGSEPEDPLTWLRQENWRLAQ